MKKFCSSLSASLRSAGLVAIYMGAFQRVAITEEDRGPYTLVYRDMAPGATGDVGAITTAPRYDARVTRLRRP